MRVVISILLLCLCLQSQAQTNVRRDLLPGGDGGVFLDGNGFTYNPGDTLVLLSQHFYPYVALANFNGTSAKPIIIINGGTGGPQSKVRGIDLSSCTHIKVTGTGSVSTYGILIKDNNGDRDNIGMNINKKSKNIEYQYVFFDSCNTGVWVKNEANCDTTVNQWMIDSITSHNNYFSNMFNQAEYYGTTDPNNTSRSITCDGQIKFYAPSRLSHIRIYNNIYRRTGRAAIQISVGTGLGNEIYGHDIELAGQGLDQQQGSGIAIGNYTSVSIYNNNVRRTYGWSISALGATGNITIESNTIDSSGAMNGQGSGAGAIVIDTRETIPTQTTTFVIKNNSVGYTQVTANNSDNNGDIYIGNERNTYTTSNIICNNVRTSGGLASLPISAHCYR